MKVYEIVTLSASPNDAAEFCTYSPFRSLSLHLTRKAAVEELEAMGAVKIGEDTYISWAWVSDTRFYMTPKQIVEREVSE